VKATYTQVQKVELTVHLISFHVNFVVYLLCVYLAACAFAMMVASHNNDFLLEEEEISFVCV